MVAGWNLAQMRGCDLAIINQDRRLCGLVDTKGVLSRRPTQLCLNKIG